MGRTSQPSARKRSIRPYWRRRTWVVLIFNVIMLVWIIAGVATATATSSTHRRGSKLSTMLLSLGQMPAGWSTQPSSVSEGSGIPGCPGTKWPLPGGVSTASAAFVDGYLPALVEGLTAYRVSIRASFARDLHGFDGCHSVKMSSGGKTTTAQFREMSFPRVGDASAAYDMLVSHSGMTAQFVFVFARKGRITMMLTEIDVGQVDTTQFEHFTRMAIAKVR